MRLKNKVALITGASRGLGAALARRFAEEGAEVLLLARTVHDLESVDDDIRQRGGTAILIPYDLENWKALNHLPQLLFEKFKRLDIFIANAAQLGTLGPIANGAPALSEWEKLYHVNVLGPLHLLKVLTPLLQLSPAGRVIGVTHRPPTDLSYWGVYYSSKAAFEHVFLSYAHETRKTSLRVNLVDPGPLDTNLRHQAFPGEPFGTMPDPGTVTEVFVDLSVDACQHHGAILTY